MKTVVLIILISTLVMSCGSTTGRSAKSKNPQLWYMLKEQMPFLSNKEIDLLMTYDCPDILVKMENLKWTVVEIGEQQVIANREDGTPITVSFSGEQCFKNERT